MRACVCVCVCACVCGVHVGVDVLGWQGIWVVASTALAVLLDSRVSYSDYLTSFHEPHSTPYRGHTALKKV